MWPPGRDVFRLTVAPSDIAASTSIRKLESIYSYRKYGARTKMYMNGQALKKKMRLCCRCTFASETEGGRGAGISTWGRSWVDGEQVQHVRVIRSTGTGCSTQMGTLYQISLFKYHNKHSHKMPSL